MWEIAVVAVIVLIAAVLIFAATRPKSFSVQRATSISAPPDKIFPLINDFKHWGSWSPYEEKGSGDEARLQRRGERPGRRL